MDNISLLFETNPDGTKNLKKVRLMNINGNNTVEDMNDEEKEGAINQGKSLEILCLVCALIQTCHNISAHSIIYL